MDKFWLRISRSLLYPLCLTPLLAGCWGNDSGSTNFVAASEAESCMACHNGSKHDDYAGLGLENPHPFGGGATLKCTACHGGNGQVGSMVGSHVPPPPEIGDELQQIDDDLAYFNRLTLTGIDKFADYQVGGVTYTAIDYLQFINPGDLRVVKEGRSCGQCHMPHVDCVVKSPLATEAGILSGAMYAIGLGNKIPQNQGLYEDTASDMAFRAVTDPDYVFPSSSVGAVEEFLEFPVFSVRGQNGALDIFQNPFYDAANLPNGLNADNTAIPDSALANLYHEQVAFTCGDCHLGSAGANNRYGDYRSSGCTSCHMRYSLDGRSVSTDPNIKKLEPFDPDDIEAPERAHVRRHVIQSVAKTLQSGEVIEGISDYACAGCHQGSNRTVMQYWGIRLDQNQDLRNRVQYPSDPVTFQNTRNDTRLFDPVVNNQTFNGRNANQYILLEDYDGDGRDDTPPDVHYDAGMGCIDCHGSHDLHGGNVGDVDIPMVSRQEQAVAIACESCHGGIDAFAATQPCVDYDGIDAECAEDANGLPLQHVTKDSNGDYYLVSRLTGNRHYVPQTKDTVFNSGQVNPLNQQAVYNPKASYAMGRADGDPTTGTGPLQTDPTQVNVGFSHTNEMNCVSCHASWTNGCIGCHLKGEYNNGDNFSNITGEQIVFRERNADFVYQTPVPFQLGVDPHNKINQVSPNTETFFQWRDRQGNFSETFTFSDRQGNGNNPGINGRGQFGALSHNAMMPHSIRGRVQSDKEGPRYCVGCHLTTDGLANFGADYDAFRTAMAANDFGALDFPLLKSHIGENPGNQLNSPMWVHMVAGLGSGLFLFDEFGCPVNPLDNNPDRFDCNNTAPAANFDPARVSLNLDRVVEDTGVSNASSNHPMLDPGQGTPKRDGALNQNMAGPLGGTLVDRLTNPVTGIILDSWIDADGQLQGDANLNVPP